MPSRAKTDPDERQAIPAVLAGELGWPRTSGGWSWDRLLDMAEQRYWANRPGRRSERGAA